MLQKYVAIFASVASKLVFSWVRLSAKDPLLRYSCGIRDLYVSGDVARKPESRGSSDLRRASLGGRRWRIRALADRSLLPLTSAFPRPLGGRRRGGWEQSARSSTQEEPPFAFPRLRRVWTQVCVLVWMLGLAAASAQHRYSPARTPQTPSRQYRREVTSTNVSFLPR